MENNEIAFSKFVTEIIVKSVAYDAVNNVFVLNQISVTEQEIKKIATEGLRYGFDEKKSISILNSLSNSISFEPSVTTDYSNVNVDRLKEGAYFHICFTNQKLGEQRIGVLFLRDKTFLVIESSICCIKFGDVLFCTTTCWNIGKSICFVVKRRQIRIPDSKSYLELSSFSSIDYYNPAPVYDVIDKKAVESDSYLDTIRYHLSPYDTFISSVKDEVVSGRLAESYFKILGNWHSLGGNSYSLSLVIRGILDNSNVSIEDTSPGLFYKVETSTPPDQETDDLKKQKSKDRLKRNATIIILLILAFLYCAMCVSVYHKTQSNNEQENELIKTNNSFKQRIQELEKNNKILKESLSIAKDEVSYFSKMKFSVGASNLKKPMSKDNNWGMWLYTEVPVQINSFDVMAALDGDIELGVYDEKGELLTTKIIDVISQRYKTVNVSIQLPKKGYYYLCMKNPKSNYLSYHKCEENEYDLYQGMLKIVGCCPKDQIKNVQARQQRAYYQYFYNIEYQLLIK